MRRFVLTTGLPCSGKTTLARRLGPALGLPVIDKDEFLERLFEPQQVGDAAIRRKLSRQSDELFQSAAKESNGAILVSHWRLRGMSEDSGTPTEWLAWLSNRIVNVRCVCPAELAAERFLRRKRHPGHLDQSISPDLVLASIQANARLEPVEIGRVIEVDTSREPEIEKLVAEIEAAFLLAA